MLHEGLGAQAHFAGLFRRDLPEVRRFKRVLSLHGTLLPRWSFGSRTRSRRLLGPVPAGGATAVRRREFAGDLRRLVGGRRSSQNFGQEIKRRSGGKPVLMRPGGPLPPVNRHRIEGNNEKKSCGIGSRVGKPREALGSRPRCCRSIVMATSSNNGKLPAAPAVREHYSRLRAGRNTASAASS
jgi:hypothetical protein